MKISEIKIGQEVRFIIIGTVKNIYGDYVVIEYDGTQYICKPEDVEPAEAK